MQIVSLGDNLHEVSKSIYWYKNKKLKKKYYQFVVCWICPESDNG